jgi:hypothetical protein
VCVCVCSYAFAFGGRGTRYFSFTGDAGKWRRARRCDAPSVSWQPAVIISLETCGQFLRAGLSEGLSLLTRVVAAVVVVVVANVCVSLTGWTFQSLLSILGLRLQLQIATMLQIGRWVRCSQHVTLVLCATTRESIVILYDRSLEMMWNVEQRALPTYIGTFNIYVIYKNVGCHLMQNDRFEIGRRFIDYVNLEQLLSNGHSWQLQAAVNKAGSCTYF